VAGFRPGITPILAYIKSDFTPEGKCRILTSSLTTLIYYGVKHIKVGADFRRVQSLSRRSLWDCLYQQRDGL